MVLPEVRERVLFGSDSPTPPNGIEFRPDNTHTLTATFADGSTATAQTTVAATTVASGFTTTLAQ